MYFRTYSYAVLVGGSNGDGAWRGLVAIVELIDPHPYIFQSAVYGRLIYTVIYVSECLFTQANPNPRLLPPTHLSSPLYTHCGKVFKLIDSRFAIYRPTRKCLVGPNHNLLRSRSGNMTGKRPPPRA